jgi:hypothetical protein
MWTASPGSGDPSATNDTATKSRFGLFVAIALLTLGAVLGDAQSQQNRVSVQVVATASEYIPKVQTDIHPGRTYTDCTGTTSYFSDFNSLSSAESGTETANVSCSSVSYPATESTYTEYRRISLVVLKGDGALYLLSCAQSWVWETCPAFVPGSRYLLGKTPTSTGHKLGTILGRAIVGNSAESSAPKLALWSDSDRKPIVLTYEGSAPLQNAPEHTARKSSPQ